MTRALDNKFKVSRCSLLCIRSSTLHRALVVFSPKMVANLLVILSESARLSFVHQCHHRVGKIQPILKETEAAIKQRLPHHYQQSWSVHAPLRAPHHLRSTNNNVVTTRHAAKGMERPTDKNTNYTTATSSRSQQPFTCASWPEQLWFCYKIWQLSQNSKIVRLRVEWHLQDKIRPRFTEFSIILVKKRVLT